MPLTWSAVDKRPVAAFKFLLCEQEQSDQGRSRWREGGKREGRQPRFSVSRSAAGRCRGAQEAAEVFLGQRFPREVDNGFGCAEVNIFIVKIYRFSECIRKNYSQPIEPD